MGVITADTVLVGACEAAMAAPPSDRALVLLCAFDRLTEDERVEELTVGCCDQRLLSLHAELFGAQLQGVASCPGCGQDVEFDVPVAGLLGESDQGPGPDPVTVSLDGLDLLCRVPTNGDLRALSELGRPADSADLAERCVQLARSSDGAVAVGDLPTRVTDALPAALAELDEGASQVLAISCPCSRAWEEELDIRTFLWTRVIDRVHRLLGEVHHLALSYGWAESDILALSPWRRRLYLEACGW